MARITPKQIRAGKKYILHTLADDKYQLILVIKREYVGSLAPRNKAGDPIESAVMRCEEQMEDGQTRFYIDPYSSYGKKWELFDTTEYESVGNEEEE